MNDEKLRNKIKDVTKSAMEEYLFEPANETTLKYIISNLAASLSEDSDIDMDIDFNITADIIDNDIEVVVHIPSLDFKLTARYSNCPALLEETTNLVKKTNSQEFLSNKTEAEDMFDIALEVINA